MLGAPDHRSQVFLGWSMISIWLTGGDKGETLVLVPFPVDCLVVESGDPPFGFLGGYQSLYLVVGHLEDSSPYGVAGLPHQGGKGLYIWRCDETELCLRVVGDESESGAGSDFTDSLGVQQRGVCEVQGWLWHGTRSLQAKQPTTVQHRTTRLPPLNVKPSSVSKVRRLILALALVLAACGGAAVEDSASTTSSVATEGDTSTTVAPTTSDGATATTEGEQDTPDTTEPPSSDRPAAPDFTLELGEGGEYTLSEGEKPVYLVFWAEW